MDEHAGEAEDYHGGAPSDERRDARDEAVRNITDDDAVTDGVKDVEDEVVIDDRAETLIDERRTSEHPEPFGHQGRPLSRSSPFVFGFTGALGVFVAWFLVQAFLNARSVLILILVSIFLAIGLNPAVDSLINRGLRRSAAVGTVFLGVIAAFIAFGFAIVPPLVTQTRELIESLPNLLQALQRSRTIDRLDEQYHVVQRAQDYVTSGNLGESAFGGIVGVGKLVLGTLFSTLTVLILTLYFLASLPAIKREVYRLVPQSRRERVALLGDEILARTGGYVSGALTVAGLAGGCSLIFLSIAGVPYALPLALLVALLDLIPVIGASIGAVVATAVAFVNGVPQGVATILFFIVYQQMENYLLYPRVMRRAVDVPASAAIMGALIGGALLGVVGALLAIPTVAAVLLLIREVWMPRQDRI